MRFARRLPQSSRPVVQVMLRRSGNNNLCAFLVGLTLFPLAAEPIWRQLFPSRDIDRETLLHHTIALLDRGLEVDHAAASKA